MSIVVLTNCCLIEWFGFWQILPRWAWFIGIEDFSGSAKCFGGECQPTLKEQNAPQVF